MVRDPEHAEKVFFSQQNENDEWTHMPYWEGDVRWNGCGMIALTMCVDMLTDKDLTPVDVMKIRADAGLDQSHVIEMGGKSVCGGDVHPQFNDINAELFGIKSLTMERTVDAFREMLARPDTVIWASTRGYDLHDTNGEKYHRAEDAGHVVAIWKYEDGIFYFKDCHYPTPELGNNVPYTEEELAEYLASWKYQHYGITLV